MADGQGQHGQGHSTPDLDEMGSRGRLVIKERAASRIAVATALSVPGVVRHSSGFGRITGRELPRATVTLTSQSILADVAVAVTWPGAVAQVAHVARAAVADTLRALTGIPVARVDLTVAAVVVNRPAPDRAPAAGTAASGHSPAGTAP